MTDKLNTRQRALAAHLEAKQFDFWQQGGGGCETCGYGGEGEIDYEALVREIDEFEKSFRGAKP